MKKASAEVTWEPREQHRDRLTCETPTLMLGIDHPAGLVNEFIAPGLLPIADRTDGLRGRTQNDREHPTRARSAGVQVAGMGIEDLRTALRPTEVLHHRGIGQTPLRDPEVAVRPGSQLNQRASP